MQIFKNAVLDFIFFVTVSPTVLPCSRPPCKTCTKKDFDGSRIWINFAADIV